MSRDISKVAVPSEILSKPGRLTCVARARVADVVEAMVTHRPYRPALPIEEAIAEIRAGLGVRYHLEAGVVCLWLLEEEGRTDSRRPIQERLRKKLERAQYAAG